MEDITKKMQFILDNYNDGTTTVDSKSKVYQKLCVEIPELLREMIKRDDLIVKGSMGNGNKNFVPWISIINRNIAAGTQEGLYVVFLFKKDMSGFYLSLNQGITNFINMFRPRKSAYSNAVLVADYFRNELDETTFSKNPISLEVSKGLGFGYQCTNIVSKFYPSGKISKKMLADDLNEIIELYDLIVKHMGTRNYNDIINEVLADESEDFLCSDDALNTIAQTVDPDDEMPFGYYRELIEVDPHRERSTRFSRMTRPRTGKIDYVKKAAKDAKYGLLGEGFVIDYEKKRLLELGRPDLAEKIRWISKESDSYGYDIESFDIDSSGTEKKIRIEVKSSTNRVDTEFFVSKNELNKSKEYKDDYCVFRIFDIKAQYPKFYRVFGKIDDHFLLDPVTYMARYKY